VDAVGVAVADADGENGVEMVTLWSCPEDDSDDVNDSDDDDAVYVVAATVGVNSPSSIAPG
jgi:hypothetical protein